MKKVLITMLLWTALVIPATVVALLLDGYVATHLTLIATLVSDLAVSSLGRPWMVEIMERLPEAAGMVAGMVVILITVWLARPVAALQKNK